MTTLFIQYHYVYPAIIEQTAENYCLYFPDLPDCVASGDIVEKVVELAQSAVQEYLWELEHETMRKFQKAPLLNRFH